MIDLKEFPKSKKLLQEFGKKNLLAFQKNIMKEAPVEGLEIPEISDEMAESYANALLTTQPRILYDFFDENELYISVIRNADNWSADVEGTDETGLYNTRIEAEFALFKIAFKLLEEKL